MMENEINKVVNKNPYELVKMYWTQNAKLN